MTTPETPPGVLAKPGEAIGIMGGGQLGRMLALAAADLGFDVHLFTPEFDSPASRVARRTWQAEWSDKAALTEFAQSVKAATIEFENIPPAAVDVVAEAGAPVRPNARTLAIAQDRLAEKTFLKDIGVEPAPFARIDAAGDIQPALDALGGSGVLKSRYSGYDGKGQMRLKGTIVADTAWAAMQRERSVLEALIDFERELSVVLARGADGTILAWDPPENDHSGGILRRSSFPSRAPQAVLDEAMAMATRLAEALDYVGVLALELFLTRDGKLLANEFAPRVHNSGHWTQDACAVGQFEQHIRAVAGWPLGDPARHADGEMINLLGPEVHEWPKHLEAGAKVHLYGKRRALDGRKMGHVVTLRPRA